ncbi:unnamed protein product [Ostreobium quekettii]|uniref:Uncharacterized protein n=1 Tax=Ostreobium quekettii TaxID=121088 RepID=A0A8S1J5H3_9CHLO|nr:unnamed protein product [Ostreobium quekettii]|eukprot:evm.model.scf_2537.4 EVM.evm.TU.scf_2537.4   scf_2537:15087-18041(-)
MGKEKKNHKKSASRALDWLRSGGRPGFVASKLFDAEDKDDEPEDADAAPVRKLGTMTCDRPAPLEVDDDDVATPRSLDDDRVAKGGRMGRLSTTPEVDSLGEDCRRREPLRSARKLRERADEGRVRFVGLQKLHGGGVGGERPLGLGDTAEELRSPQTPSSEQDEEKRLKSEEHRRRVADLRKVTGRGSRAAVKAPNRDVGARSGELAFAEGRDPDSRDALVSTPSSDGGMFEYGEEKRRHLASSSSIEEERLARKAREEVEEEVVRRAEAESLMPRMAKVATAVACNRFEGRMRDAEVGWKKRMQGMQEEIERLRRENSDLSEDLRGVAPLREVNERLVKECKYLQRVAKEKEQAAVEKDKDLRDAQSSFSRLRSQVNKVRDSYEELQEQLRVSKRSEKELQAVLHALKKDVTRCGWEPEKMDALLKQTTEEFNVDYTKAKNERLEKERHQMKQEILMLKQELQRTRSTATC